MKTILKFKKIPNFKKKTKLDQTSINLNNILILLVDFRIKLRLMKSNGCAKHTAQNFITKPQSKSIS